MPATAGIQVRFQFKFKNRLDSAGMTTTRVDFQSTNSESLGLVGGISRPALYDKSGRR
jgi:hypothetical protein